MPGPAPKPASQRRRRNVTTGRAVLPADGRGGRAPTLPGAKDMLASTRTWWRTVWASPMATVWIEADMPALVRLAQLKDLTARQFRIVADGPIVHLSDRTLGRLADLISDRPADAPITIEFESPVQANLLSEMRQLEDRLGLSPMARRKLEWEIAGDVASDGAASAGDEVAKQRRRRFERVAG